MKDLKIFAKTIEQQGFVLELSCKPMPVMSNGNPFHSDVYCPFCGVNLSGFYGDEPTSFAAYLTPKRLFSLSNSMKRHTKCDKTGANVTAPALLRYKPLRKNGLNI